MIETLKNVKWILVSSFTVISFFVGGVVYAYIQIANYQILNLNVEKIISKLDVYQTDIDNSKTSDILDDHNFIEKQKEKIIKDKTDIKQSDINSLQPRCDLMTKRKIDNGLSYSLKNRVNESISHCKDIKEILEK